MSRPTRRTFLKGAAATVGLGSFVIAGTKASGRVLGANDTIRIAVAGINGRGGSHIDEFCKMKNVQVTYLVDPDSRLFKSQSEHVRKRGGNTPKCVQDIRKALEDKELDAVSIASCNHWHSLLTIWSCQAGKDVYVEKPCSHNVFEGRKCVEAARKYDRIVQHGTQSRSDSSWARQIAAIQTGKYGKLLVSKGYANKVRWSIGFKQPKEPPKELDYNLWLGPAREQPYHENLVHYNWHWFWDFGNGEIGNQGVHQMDIARWAVTAATGKVGPKSVVSCGGRYVDEPDFKDQGETPNMQLSVMDFDGTLLVFEVRGLTSKTGPGGKQFPSKVDNEFYLEAGAIIKGKFYPKGKTEGEPLVKADIKTRPGGHFENFIDAVRSRKREELNAEIEEGHLSAVLCHLGNISYRLGKDVPSSTKPEPLGDCPQVIESVNDIVDNVVGALGEKVKDSPYRLGAVLQYDAAAEKFVGNDEANKLLTRPPRGEFTVPEQV